MSENSGGITAPIFNVQTYSIHDGPGIRVTVFVKGCPLRCLWCANPESNLASPQLMFYSNKCTGCGICVGACPGNAISMTRTDGGACSVTDRALCKNCGACAGVCPNEARELAGKEMSVKEILEKVQRDRLFIDASGGGVTVSGGEPLMHPEFTEALLREARAVGLHTAVESCSFASKAVIDRVYKYVDLALLDIKHMDSEAHKRLTGVPNEQILENIRYIHCELGVPAMISLPTIPGYNDSDENIAATARFVAEELGADVKMRLLPYHRLGESKNESLGKTMNMSIEVPTDEHMQRLKLIAESFGVETQIGG